MSAISEYVTIATRQYIRTLLWSETDENGEPFDGLYSVDDVANPRKALADVATFVRSNWADLQGIDPEQCGHDFALTRNGHGAGFWDRGLGELGDRLTQNCKSYGETYLYLGDDGYLYLV